MIGSLRLRLTAFYTAVTGGILLAMTVLCLFVSEKDTQARTLQQFERYMGTITAYVGSQERVSTDWLRQVEAAGNLSISIQDGSMPLYSLRHSGLEPQFRQVRRMAEESCYLTADRIWAGKSCAFFAQDPSGRAFLGGMAVVGRENTVIEVLLIQSLEDMEQGIARQRLVICLWEALALLVLGLFCWYYTGRLLGPIRESQRRQAQFTAAASHELRTPLAAILSAASAMEQSEEGENRRFLAHIQREGRQMSRLIGDLLVLSSGDSQDWALETAPTEPDMLLLEAYESYLPLAKEKGLTLAISLPEENIPSIPADRERLYQVLSILLDNALSYTPAPGQIRLSLERKKRALRLLVSDSGPGVPDSEKERIFQRFHRGEKARSDKSHFGLGLSIASQIVTGHRGKLWVRDAALGGAEFVVELPAAPEGRESPLL